jgi:hypothetical protein
MARRNPVEPIESTHREKVEAEIAAFEALAPVECKAFRRLAHRFGNGGGIVTKRDLYRAALAMVDAVKAASK